MEPRLKCGLQPEVGMQRAQMSEEDIQAVLESYRMLSRAGW